MTQKEKPSEEDKKMQTLDEICENTRAIRRVTNRILDHLHEYQTGTLHYEDTPCSDPDDLSWDDLENNDDMYM